MLAGGEVGREGGGGAELADSGEGHCSGWVGLAVWGVAVNV